jgi:hypothetical protein
MGDVQPEALDPSSNLLVGSHDLPDLPVPTRQV